MGDLHTLAGQPVSQLGLSGNPEMTDSRCVDVAFDAGVNYFFFYHLSFQPIVAGLNRLVKKNRDAICLTTGTEERDSQNMRQYFDSVCRRLGVDGLDVFFVEYVSPEEDVDRVAGEVLDELHTWKEKGLIRYVGASIHNREVALQFIKSGRIDVLMHRYNMAHRRCEDQVLPAAKEANIPVVSFTNTRWGSLLKGHHQWTGPVPAAVDCYRFVLQNGAVKIALSAPRTRREWEENLRVITTPTPITPEQLTQWRNYGDLIYGDGGDGFETRFP